MERPTACYTSCYHSSGRRTIALDDKILIIGNAAIHQSPNSRTRPMLHNGVTSIDTPPNPLAICTSISMDMDLSAKVYTATDLFTILSTVSA